MSIRDFFLALLAVVIWGYNIVAVKTGVAELPPLMMTSLRLAIVAAVVLPFTRAKLGNLPWVMLLSFTFSTLHFSLMFLGLKATEAGTGAILIQMGTPLATILSVMFFKERLSALQAAALIASFIGIATLTFSPTLPAAMPFCMLLGSAMAWAVSNLIVKHGPSIDMLELIGWTSLLGVPQVALASWLFESGQLAAVKHASWHAWLAVIYCAVMSSTLAYWIWYRLLKKYPISRIVPMSLLSPILSVIFGIYFFGDSLDSMKLFGGLLAVCSIVVMNFDRRIRLLWLSRPKRTRN